VEKTQKGGRAFSITIGERDRFSRALFAPEGKRKLTDGVYLLER